MSLKEKFQKAGLTETKVKMPEAKITDENGDKQTYKISRKSQKLVNQYQSRNGKVVNTPGAMVKGASFASKREKRKVRQTKALDAVEKRAGSAIASGNAGILSGNAKNISVLANAIAKSRKNAENVRTPIAATKGSVFVNKGYNPQSKAKSASETRRLETTAQKADAFARRMQAKETALDTEGKEGLGKVGRTAYDLGKVGTQLAADATAGLLVPGGGLASVASRSFGQGVMQAEDEGKSGARAVLYGAGNAAIEAGTEKLTAAAKPLKAIYGAGVVDNVLGKLTKKLGSSAKGRSALATIAKAAGGEAAEEALADALQVPLQRAVLENGAKFDADWAANTVYDALLGGVMGGVLGGGSVAVDRAQNRSTNSAKVMADAMQRARERNQKKAAGNAPPMMQQAGNTSAILRSAGVDGTMNVNGGAGYGREGQVPESRGFAGQPGREMPERGEIDPRGILGGIRSDGNSVRNENAGRFSLAQQYGTEVKTVTAEELRQRGMPDTGYSNNGVIYVNENLAPEKAQEVIAHELVHTMKQNGFEPYLGFTKGVENRLIQNADTSDALNILVRHRGYQGAYDDLDLDQKFAVLDELNATLYGGYIAHPDFFYNNIGSIMKDPENYVSELSDIMEQYKARNDVEDDADWQRIDEDVEEEPFAVPVDRTDDRSESRRDVVPADSGRLNTPESALIPEELERYQVTPDVQQSGETRNGFYPEGANAARPVHVPMYDAAGKPISKSASTVLGAKAIPDEVIPQIEQMIADGKMSYTTIKDQESLQRARTTVERYGFDGAMQDFRKAVNSGQVSKDIMTLGQTLLNTAANNRDGHAVAEILTLYQSMNTNLGQAMQAASILRKLEPESQLYGIRRVVDNLNDVLKKAKKDYDVDIDPELIQKFTEQDTQEGRDAVMQEIYQNVAQQVPSTWKEKWDAWRYLAMLGNPRTHIRNIIGNAAFQPVRFLKNEIAAGMEAGLNKLGMNIERTKSFSASPALYRAAWNDYANAKDILGGSKYNEIKTAIEKNRRILPGILESARVMNSAALEAEDAIAKRITYADSLAGYLKANGITADQFINGEADSGIVNKARNYAAQEALKATYQDKNAFSNRIVDIVSKTGIVGDAIIPFKRTPANILARSIEYSPIGAVKAITYDLAKVKSGEKTAAQVIDAAAAGLTGTGLFALGAYLFADGLLTVAQGDDKEDKWAQLLGHQGYALELPDGTSVTIDWLAPDSLPFFMGAEMMSSAGENGWNLESVWNALKSVANPMLDLSMLQSVNDLIDSVKYAESSPLAAMVPSAIVSYFSQAVPTIGGQIERTAEDKRMMTYTEKDGKLPTDFQYALGKMSAKIPGWDYQQVPYINEWGQEKQTGTPFQRAFNNFLNPAYASQVDMDKVEKSIQSVYDATGEKSVLPNKAERTLTINKKKKNLTASEYERYAKKLGKDRYTLLKEAVNSDAYGELSNAEKAEFISEIYSYSKAMTEHDLFGKEINKKWYTEAKESGNVLGAIRDHVLYTVNGNYSDKAKTAVEDIGITLDQYSAMRNGLDADGNGAVSQSEAKSYLDGQDFSRDQKSQLWKIINKSWKSNPYG